MSTQYPAVRVTISTPDLYTAFGELLRETEEPKRESVLCLLAHFKTENSGSAWNFNLTNVRRHGDVDYCTIPFCSEIEKATDNTTHEVFYARDSLSAASLAARGHQAIVSPQRCQFASYPSLEDGARAYLAMLQTPRYARSLAAMWSGDPAAFAHALHQDGWMTANEVKYTALLISCFNELASELPSQ